MKTLFMNRNIMVSIFVVMLLICGVQGIIYAQGRAPTVTPSETNTTIRVNFRDTFYAYDEKSYQVQLRRKEPQGDWILKCGTIKDFFDSGVRTFTVIFTGLEPDTTYQARWRGTNQPNCSDNPLNPDPWSPIGEGTTFLVTPPHVEFVDVNLAKALRRTLNLYTIGVDFLKIPKEELAKLTHLEYNNELDTPASLRISNLTGLEHAPQLITLALKDNDLRDITPLASLTQLTELNLSNNKISDITPLSQLTQLIELSLGGFTGNNVSDISPLAQLARLTTLYLKANNITDITPLTELPQLTELYLSSNDIIDIIPLSQLTQLTRLDLSSNNINDITPLKELTQLIKLDLSSNNINDITPLKELTQLTDLDLKINNISDVTPLVELRSLEWLFLLLNPIKDSFPLNALLEVNPDVYIDIEVLKEERPIITVSTLQPLTGATLDGAVVKLTLSSGGFDKWRSDFRDAFTISGIPGIEIGRYGSDAIEVVNDTEAEIKLIFEGDLITSDSVLTLTVAPEAITGYNGDAYTLEIPVPGVPEDELVQTITASAPYPLTAATLNGSMVTLKLTDAVFDGYLYLNVNVSGIPEVTIAKRTGSSRKAIRRVSDTEITIELRFLSNITEDATLIFTVASSAIDRYNGPPLTAEIPVSATNEVEPTGELVASSAFPLTKATLNGSIVKLTLQNKSYHQGHPYDYDEPVIGISGIPGVKTARLGSGSYLRILSETEIWIKLFFNGNVDNDATLTFTVPPSLIKDYNAPPLVATFPITVKTGKQMLISETLLPSMYWINTDTNKIESLDRFDAVTDQVASLTVDTADGKVYWSEHSSSAGTIKRANLDGTNVEVLVTHPTTPQSITVDAPGKKLYWINSLEGKIQRVDLSGGNIETIIQLDDTITHIAVDTKGGKLYWVDSEFRIRRMNLDGTDIETILTGWNSYLSRGIGGMVIADGKIYWTEQQVWYRVSGKIHRANLNGTNVETLATPFGNPTRIAVDTLNGKVYWANSFGGLQRLDINGGDIENVLYGIVAPGSFVLGPVSTQPTLPTTPETPATTDAAVSISPASVVSPAVGEQLEVHLNITGGEDVRGYQATVQFDTTTLRHVESSNGDYLPDGALFISPAVDGNLVKLTATALIGESSGAGTLATLTFEVVAVKASTLTLSNVLLVNNTGESSHPRVEDGHITVPSLNADVNGDGSVDLQDLAIVQSHLGQTGQNEADVNGDGIVDVADLAFVAGAIENGAAAPSLHPEMLEIFRSTNVKQWLSQLQHLDLTDTRLQRGILFLEQLLAALTPKETALLANYPNPFNPETWIPYQLAKDADVTLHIYAVDGTLVRTLTLGHQPAGMYQTRSRAAYWNGKNAFGEPVASGVYFYTLTAGDFTATRKMLIRK